MRVKRMAASLRCNQGRHIGAWHLCTWKKCSNATCFILVHPVRHCPTSKTSFFGGVPSGRHSWLEIHHLSKKKHQTIHLGPKFPMAMTTHDWEICTVSGSDRRNRHLRIPVSHYVSQACQSQLTRRAISRFVF